MPLYEYQCKKCAHRFEQIESFSAEPVKICPVCKGRAERLISAPAIRFKGSGFYLTDYVHKPSSSGSSESAKGGAKKSDQSSTASSSGNGNSASSATEKNAPAASGSSAASKTDTSTASSATAPTK